MFVKFIECIFLLCFHAGTNMGKLYSYTWKIIVTILAVLFIYWYAVTQVDWDTLINSPHQIHWEYFWIGTLLALLSNWLDGYAWYRILHFLDSRIKVYDALMSHWIGFSLGILIPIAGTVELATKTVFLQRRYPGLTSEEVISSIAAIRTAFLITAYLVWGFLIFSLAYEGVISPVITVVLIILIWSLLTIVIIFLFIFFGNTNRLASLIELIGKPFLHYEALQKLFRIIEKWLRNFAESFQNILKMPRNEKAFMLVAVFTQNIIKWISVYFLFLAVVDLPFYVVMVVSVLGGFVNLIPAAIPALAGLREIVKIEILKQFEVDQITSTVAAIIQSLGLWFFFTLALLAAIPYVLISLKKSYPMTEISEKDEKLSEDIDE